MPEMSRVVDDARAPARASSSSSTASSSPAYCYRMLGSRRRRGRGAGDVHPRVARATTASRAAPRCARGSTASRRTSASTCSTSRKRRARPMDLGPAGEPIVENLRTPGPAWIEPMPDGRVVGRRRSGRDRRRARVGAARVRRGAPAPAAAPARGADPARGAALEGGGGRGAPRHERRVREQRAPASARDARGERRRRRRRRRRPSTPPTPSSSQRYVAAFEQYDMDALTSLIHEDATQSMPPYDLWLAGATTSSPGGSAPGTRCRDSRVVPVATANGAPGVRRSTGRGRTARATSRGRCRCSRSRTAGSSSSRSSSTSRRLFPRFGLPLEFGGVAAAGHRVASTSPRPMSSTSSSSSSTRSAAGPCTLRCRPRAEGGRARRPSRRRARRRSRRSRRHRAARGQQGAHTVAETGKVSPGDGAADGEGDLVRPGCRHRTLDRPRRGNSSTGSSLTVLGVICKKF